MRKEEIHYRLVHGPQTVKHLTRLYLFAGASFLSDQELTRLRQEIMIRLGLSETGFMKAMEVRSAKWNARSVRQSMRIASHPLMSDFARRRGPDFKGKGLSLKQGKALLCREYMLAFHSLSAQLGQNCFKPEWIDQLALLLEDPHGLEPVLSLIERPIVRAGKGLVFPTDELFVFHILAGSHLIADALYFSQEDTSDVRLQLIQDVFRASRYWSADELALFIKPAGITVPSGQSSSPADHPLDGLEAVLDPSLTLVLIEETPQSTSRSLRLLSEPDNESSQMDTPTADTSSIPGSQNSSETADQSRSKRQTTRHVL